jgi:SAM-dependent methyltransferase
MHPSVMEWVRQKIREAGVNGKAVLEVGSMNVNGSVRGLFAGAARYVGIDFREGPGVDQVMNAHELGFADSEFHVVVSTEMLEHDDAFWLSMREMGRVLRPGGILIVTARGNGFIPHGYPHDYWRFMPQSIEKLLALASCEVVEAKEDWEARSPRRVRLGSAHDSGVR